MLTQEMVQALVMAKEGLIDLQKATFNQPGTSTPMVGFQAYALEPIKELIPKSTPLLDEIPRTGGGYTNQANWKVVRNLNNANITSGVPQASRNAQIAMDLYEYSATFKTLYMEAGATLQARLAGQGFDDPDARATKSALISHQIENEWILLGGNTTSTGLQLGQVSGLTMTKTSTSAGSIGVAAVFANVVPLTLDGWRQTTAWGVGRQAGGTDVGAVRTVTPVYGAAFSTNLGAGQPSAQVTVGSMTGGTNQVTLTWTAKLGAVAYAVYISDTTGHALYHSTVYGCSAVINTLPAGTQDVSTITGDRSANQYVYDGIITQIVRNDPNTGAPAGYVKSLNATLTPTGKGGIVEFDDFLIDRMQYLVDEFDIWVGRQQTPNITAKVISGSTATPYMVSIASGDVNLVGGQRVTSYNHPITAEKLAVRYHPYLPPGIVLFKCKGLPAEYYRNDTIPNPWQIKEWLSYTDVHWPQNTFQQDVGVATAEVLQGYVPFANGILQEVLLG